MLYPTNFERSLNLEVLNDVYMDVWILYYSERVRKELLERDYKSLNGTFLKNQSTDFLATIHKVRGEVET